MKTSHLLLLAAASIAPLQAATPQENIAIALQTQTPSKGTAADREAVNPALAQIAAGNDYISFSNLTALAQALVASGLIDEEDAADMPFESLIYAANLGDLTKATAGFQKIYQMLTLCGYAYSWSDSANEAYAPALKAASNEDSVMADPKVLEELAADLKQFELPANYITIGLSPASMAQVSMMFMQIPTMLSNLPEGITCNAIGTKVDITIDLGALMQDSDRPEVILEALKGKTLAITLELKGANLQIAVASDPAEIKWAASADESVLATRATDIMNAQLSSKSFATLNISKESLNTYKELGADSYTTPLAMLFTMLSDVVPANKATFEAAAASVKQLGEAISVMAPPNKEDMSMLVWFDEGFYGEITADFSANYVASKTSGLGNINDQTIFAMQNSGYELKGFNFEPLLKALPGSLSIVDAVCCTLKPSEAAPILPALELAKATLANPAQAPEEIKSIVATVAASAPSAMDMVASMGTSYGITYTMNADPAADETVVAFADLKDKKKFTDGFAQVYTNLNETAAKFGVPVPPLNVQVSEAGPITSYTISEGPLTLQASLSDSCVTISNCPAANAAMQSSIAAGKGIELAGGILYVNLANAVSVIDKYELCDDEKGDVGPFRDLIITYKNVNADSTFGSIRVALPLKK